MSCCGYWSSPAASTRKPAKRSKPTPRRCCSAPPAFGKSRLGRADFAVEPGEIADAARDGGYTELPINSKAAALVAELPLLHRDPFDRLLVAQAMIEPALLYTADPKLPAYSELIRRIRLV